MDVDAAVCSMRGTEASLKVGNQNERSHRAHGGNEGRTSGDQGECLIKSSNTQLLELHRRRLAEHRRDNARPTPQRQRTRLPQDSSQALT